ncbi:MAG: hypothetical protein H7A55_06025 [Verrucomicrobiaceae bacterium]|nr:hypothetical protein [Verrucomicrobiaceae bacterium]
MKEYVLILAVIFSKLAQVIGPAQLFQHWFGSLGFLVGLALGGTLIMSVTGLLFPIALVAAYVLEWDWWWYIILVVGQFESPQSRRSPRHKSAH